MSCGCGNHKDREGNQLPRADVPRRIAPADPCVFCAYKHFHTARRLAEEAFYTAKNRGDIEGELVLAQWHLWKLNHLDLCRRLRDARHMVERFREKEIDWAPAIEAFDTLIRNELAEIDALAAAEAKKILEEEQTNKKEA